MIPVLDFPSLTFRPHRYQYRGVGDWSGHIPFACDLIAALEPAVFVELGTYLGESYFAFCQAIQEHGSPCSAFAVDTWRGDQHTGDYSEGVFADVERYNKSRYDAFSSLLRMPFDEAAHRFPDESIELLHIDGYHTYDVVRHDFETWLPKLKPGGIVVLHDTAIRHADFGVWRYWAELRERYQTFEFTNACGLGVVSIPGPRPERGILELLFQKNDSLPPRIRAYYEICTARLEHEKEKSNERDVLTKLYWRGAEEEFSELKNAQNTFTLCADRTTVRLNLPPVSGAIDELRLDIVQEATVLRVFKVALLDGSGSLIWSSSGDEFFEHDRYWGMQTITGGPLGALVVVNKQEGSVLIRVDQSWRTKLENGAVMEMEVQGVEAPVRELSEALARTERMAYDEARLWKEAFERTELLVNDRTAEARQLSGALEATEQLALERLEKLEVYDRALTRAQKLVEQAEQTAQELAAALARVEQLALERMEQLEVYDKALTHAQKLVAQRDQSVQELAAALGRAEQLALQSQEQLRERDEALLQARKLVEQKEQSIQQLSESLDRAEQLIVKYEAEAHRLEAALTRACQQERQLRDELNQTIEARERNSREIAGLSSLLKEREAALWQLQSQLEATVASLSWRLTSPLRAIGRFIQPGRVPTTRDE